MSSGVDHVQVEMDQEGGVAAFDLADIIGHVLEERQQDVERRGIQIDAAFSPARAGLSKNTFPAQAAPVPSSPDLNNHASCPLALFVPRSRH